MLSHPNGNMKRKAKTKPDNKKIISNVIKFWQTNYIYEHTNTTVTATQVYNLFRESIFYGGEDIVTFKSFSGYIQHLRSKVVRRLNEHNREKLYFAELKQATARQIIQTNNNPKEYDDININTDTAATLDISCPLQSTFNFNVNLVQAKSMSTMAYDHSCTRLTSCTAEQYQRFNRNDYQDDHDRSSSDRGSSPRSYKKDQQHRNIQNAQNKKSFSPAVAYSNETTDTQCRRLKPAEHTMCNALPCSVSTLPLAGRNFAKFVPPSVKNSKKDNDHNIHLNIFQDDVNSSEPVTSLLRTTLLPAPSDNLYLSIQSMYNNSKDNSKDLDTMQNSINSNELYASQHSLSNIDEEYSYVQEHPPSIKNSKEDMLYDGCSMHLSTLQDGVNSREPVTSIPRTTLLPAPPDNLYIQSMYNYHLSNSYGGNSKNLVDKMQNSINSNDPDTSHYSLMNIDDEYSYCQEQEVVDAHIQHKEKATTIDEHIQHAHNISFMEKIGDRNSCRSYILGYKSASSKNVGFLGDTKNNGSNDNFTTNTKSSDNTVSYTTGVISSTSKKAVPTVKGKHVYGETPLGITIGSSATPCMLELDGLGTSIQQHTAANFITSSNPSSIVKHPSLLSWEVPPTRFNSRPVPSLLNWVPPTWFNFRPVAFNVKPTLGNIIATSISTAGFNNSTITSTVSNVGVDDNKMHNEQTNRRTKREPIANIIGSYDTTAHFDTSTVTSIITTVGGNDNKAVKKEEERRKKKEERRKKGEERRKKERSNNNSKNNIKFFWRKYYLYQNETNVVDATEVYKHFQNTILYGQETIEYFNSVSGKIQFNSVNSVSGKIQTIRRTKSKKKYYAKLLSK